MLNPASIDVNDIKKGLSDSAVLKGLYNFILNPFRAASVYSL